MIYLGRRYYFKYFKSCLPQILFVSFLNTLYYLFLGHFFGSFGLIFTFKVEFKFQCNDNSLEFWESFVFRKLYAYIFSFVLATFFNPF